MSTAFHDGLIDPADLSPVRRGLMRVFRDRAAQWEKDVRYGRGHLNYPPVYDSNHGSMHQVVRFGFELNLEGSPSRPPALRAAIEEVLARLALEGVVRVSSHGGGPEEFFLTAFGVEYIKTDDGLGLPPDPTGVVDKFLAEFGTVSEANVMTAYLGQAVESLQRRMNLAGATMIGCVYELALLQLADAVVVKWGTSPTGADITKRHKDTLSQHAAAAKTERPPGIAKVADAVQAVLLANKGALKQEQAYWVQSSFGSAFFHVRILRNKAGHPSGDQVPLDDVFRHVVTFNLDYRQVRAIITTLEQ